MDKLGHVAVRQHTGWGFRVQKCVQVSSCGIITSLHDIRELYVLYLTHYLIKLTRVLLTCPKTANPQVPNTPDAPLVRDVTPSSVTLIFTRAPDIRYYNLEFQESSLLPDYKTVPRIEETQYTVGNLKQNTEYTFRVSGENEQGLSGPSRETTVTTTGGQGKPFEELD